MLKAIKCFYRGCKRPEVEEGPPVATNRPSDAKMWSDPATWENGLPGNDSDVAIKGRKSLIALSQDFIEKKNPQNNVDFDLHITTNTKTSSPIFLRIIPESDILI